MRAIWTLTLKDLLLLSRDRVGAFFSFVWPLGYAIFFGFLFSTEGRSGGAGAVNVVVVDEDGDPRARAFIDELRAENGLRVEEAASREEAANLVRAGRKEGYVILPRGFGAAGGRIFRGEPMRLEIGVDPSKSAAAGMLEGLVTAHAYQQMQKVFTDPNAMRTHAREGLVALRESTELSPAQKRVLESLLGSVDRLYEILSLSAAGHQRDPQATVQGFGTPGWRPIEITRHEVTRPPTGERAYPRSSFAICFPQGIIWGVLACAATFAASLLVERARGTLPRLRTAPLELWQILGGKAAACFLTTVTVIVLMLVVARVAFGVRPTSLPLLAIAVVSVSSGVIGVMMVFSVLGKTEAAVSGISWAVIVVMAMLGGGMLPLFLMPSWMVPLSNLSIVKWSILALEGGIWRDFTWSEMLVPCAVLLLVGVVGFGVGSAAFRISERD